jgi:hypothetical protein
MALVVSTKWFHKTVHLILCIGFYGPGLLHKIFTCLSILVSGLCMLFTILIAYFPVISLRQRVVSSIYTAMGCPVTEVTSFHGTQHSRDLLPHLKMESPKTQCHTLSAGPFGN